MRHLQGGGIFQQVASSAVIQRGWRPIDRDSRTQQRICPARYAREFELSATTRCQPKPRRLLPSSFPKPSDRRGLGKSGAGDGIRTHDPNLGKLCSAPELHPRCAGRAFELPSDRPLTGEPAGGAPASPGPSKLPPTFAVGRPCSSSLIPQKMVGKSALAG